MVLKTGPDRPVQLGTGVLFGSVLQKNWKFRKSSQKPETDGWTVKTANRHGWTGYGPVLGFPKLTVLKPKTIWEPSTTAPSKTHRNSPYLSPKLTVTPHHPKLTVTPHHPKLTVKLDLGSMCVCERERDGEGVKLSKKWIKETKKTKTTCIKNKRDEEDEDEDYSRCMDLNKWDGEDWKLLDCKDQDKQRL